MSTGATSKSGGDALDIGRVVVESGDEERFRASRRAVAAQRQRIRRVAALREVRQEMRLPAPRVAVAAMDEQQRRATGVAAAVAAARRQVREDFEAGFGGKHRGPVEECAGRRSNGLAKRDERRRRIRPARAGGACVLRFRALAMPAAKKDVILPEAPPARSVYDAGCRRCARLATFLDDVRADHPHYFCAPVPPFGDPAARLLIVGLAPGMHGANASGRPFTGDHAGILLYATLHAFGYAFARRRRRAGRRAHVDRVPHHQRGEVPAAAEQADARRGPPVQRLPRRRPRAGAGGRRRPRAGPRRPRRGAAGAGLPLRRRPVRARPGPSRCPAIACSSTATTARATTPTRGG